MKRNIVILVALISSGVLASVGFYSAKAASPQGARGGAMAKMTVSAEARHGASLPTIQEQDVRVTEGHGNDRDSLVSWVPATGDRAGLELLVLIDDGSSLDLGSELGDLRAFVNSQPATTLVGVAYMRYGMAEMEQNFTADHAAAAKVLRVPMGVTGVTSSPYFSLQDLLKRWPVNDNNPRHEILLISSGIDPDYSGGLVDPYVNEVTSDLERAGVVVYSIYAPAAGHEGHSFWRINMGQSYMSQVVTETGGESYYTGTAPAVAFAPYLNLLALQLQHQYLLTFTPKPQKKSGLQPIGVSTELSGVDLVAADKVYVPASNDQ